MIRMPLEVGVVMDQALLEMEDLEMLASLMMTATMEPSAAYPLTVEPSQLEDPSALEVDHSQFPLALKDAHAGMHARVLAEC